MGETSTVEAKTQSGDGVAMEAARPYRAVLRESAGTLTDCLLPTPHLLEYLQQKSVLSADMVDKVRVLLKFLMNLGPDSVDRLVEGLRLTEQDFLANILAGQSYT